MDTAGLRNVHVFDMSNGSRFVWIMTENGRRTALKPLGRRAEPFTRKTSGELIGALFSILRLRELGMATEGLGEEHPLVGTEMMIVEPGEGLRGQPLHGLWLRCLFTPLDTLDREYRLERFAAWKRELETIVAGTPIAFTDAAP